jgi:hypothetical protein
MSLRSGSICVDRQISPRRPFKTALSCLAQVPLAVCRPCRWSTCVFFSASRTAGPIDKSLSVTTSPTKGVDHAGNGLLKAKQPFGRHRDHCQSTPAYHRGLNPLAVLPTPTPSGRHAAAPDLFLFDHLVGGVLFDRHPAHIRCADLSSDLEARENAFQCLHCFLFVQLL